MADLRAAEIGYLHFQLRAAQRRLSAISLELSKRDDAALSAERAGLVTQVGALQRELEELRA